jgi:hypothetical protein
MSFKEKSEEIKKIYDHDPYNISGLEGLAAFYDGLTDLQNRNF